MVAAARTRRQVGPVERAARRVDARDEKRRVLLALAAFVDEGVANPSILELSRRSRVHRMAVVMKLEKLAREGVIALKRGADRERTTYRFLIPTTPSDRKDPPMTETKEAAPAVDEKAPEATTDPTVDLATAINEPITRSVPNWQREGYWPEGPVGPWSWEALTEAREAHNAAAADLALAREVEDVDGEQDALRAVCEAILGAMEPLRVSIPVAEAAMETARQEAVPKFADGVIPDAEANAHRAAVVALRDWADPDMLAMRKVLTRLERDTFYPEDSDRPIPSLEAKVRRLLDEAGLR